MSAIPTPQASMDFDGLVVAVTGAAGGLGAGIVRRFAAAGASVVLHHRGEASPVNELRAGLRSPTAAVRADLTDPLGPQRLVDAAVEAFGALDVLVNNAGVQPLSALADVSAEEWDEVIAVNLTAVHRCTQAFAHHRRAQGGGGAIVNIASIEGLQPAPDHGHYAASKAAVRMHTRAAALELGPDGIRVNVVSPGLINRPGLASAWPDGVERWHRAAPLTRLGEPEDVGDACVFLASPMARFITGAELVVDGGVLAHPTW